MAVKLLSFDTLISVSDDDPVLNLRFLAFSVSIAALYLCSFAIWRSADQLTALERRAWSVYPILVIAANFLTLWIFTAEVMDFFDQRLVTVGWAIYSALPGLDILHVEVPLDQILCLRRFRAHGA